MPRRTTHECTDQPTLRNTTWSNPPPDPIRRLFRGLPLQSMETSPDAGVTRRAVNPAESRRASRGWWDADADAYQAEHGAFLGDVDFVWCPEGLREADARLLGDVAGKGRPGDRLRRRVVLPLAAHAGREGRGQRPFRRDAAPRGRRDHPIGCTRAAPAGRRDRPAVRHGVFDVVCTAFGAVPFVADSGRVMREVFRVLRPAGAGRSRSPIRCAGCSSTTRAEGGLVAVHSYFDRRAYVEQDEDARPDLRGAAPHAR